MCPLCVAHAEVCLTQLPYLADAVRAFLNPGLKTAFESKVNATRTPSAPINLHVLSLLDEISDAILYADGRSIADLIRQPAESYQVWVKGTEQTVYLDGVDRAIRIRRVHQKVSDVVGLAPVFQRRLAPCPSCSLLTLGTWSGTEKIECTNDHCLATFTLKDYEEYCTERSKE